MNLGTSFELSNKQAGRPPARSDNPAGPAPGIPRQESGRDRHNEAGRRRGFGRHPVRPDARSRRRRAPRHKSRETAIEAEITPRVITKKVIDIVPQPKGMLPAKTSPSPTAEKPAATASRPSPHAPALLDRRAVDPGKPAQHESQERIEEPGTRRIRKPRLALDSHQERGPAGIVDQAGMCPIQGARPNLVRATSNARAREICRLREDRRIHSRSSPLTAIKAEEVVPHQPPGAEPQEGVGGIQDPELREVLVASPGPSRG